MGRRPKYISRERYALVRKECEAYLMRQKVIDAGKGDPSLVECFRELNGKLERICLNALGAEREAAILREDIANGKGWCKSDLCEILCYEYYVRHKRRVVGAIAAYLGI